MPIKATFTGDVTDLRRGTQQARDEFRKVGTEAQGAARQLKAVGSSFDGSRLEGQALRVVRGVERIGGAARLTDSELAKNSRTLSEVIQKYERMGTEVPAAVRRVADELRQAQGAARQLETASSGIGASLGRGASALASGLGIGLGAGLGLTALTAIGGAVREIADEGARMGPLAQSFERLQGGAVQAQATLEAMRGTTRGVVSDVDLMRQSNQATQLGLAKLGVDMSTLAGTAVTLGRAVGNDATESIDALIGALGRGSTEVLDNLGVTLKMNEAYDIYAARIGKTASALTDQEKKQAFVTVGMERATEAAARLGEQQLTVTEQAGRIATTLSDAGAAMVSTGNESGVLALAVGAVADGLNELVSNVGEVRAEFVATLGPVLRLTGALGDAVSNSNLLGAALRVTVAPGLNALNLVLEGTALTLERIRDARRWLSGQLTGQTDVNLPSRNQDIQLGDRTNGQGPRAQAALDAAAAKLAADHAREQEEALRRLEQQQTRSTAAQARLNEELAKLAGRDLVSNAVTLANNLERVGSANILPRSLPQLVEQLQGALDRARELGPEFAGATRTIEAQLRKLTSSPAYREVFQASLRNPQIGLGERSSLASISGNSLAGALNPFISGSTSTLVGGRATSSPIGSLIAPSGDPLSNQIWWLQSAVTPLRRAEEATADWRAEVRGLAQSFAQLAQIAGPSLGSVTRGIGTTVASFDTATQMVDSLAAALPRLGLTRTNEQGQTVLSGRGQALAGSLGALTTGAALGSTTSNPWLGGALGAGGGLATGAMVGLTGAALVGTAGLGAAAAIYMSWRNRQAEKKALSQQRAEVIASAGGYEQFREAVEGAGFAFDHFLTMFNSNDADVFTDAMNRLNVAMAEQQTQATALTKGLEEVARVQGVLSQQQIAQIRTMRPGDAGADEVLAFMAGQRAQAEAGLVQAVAGLEASGTDALATFGLAAQAAASGLYVAFTEALAQGESAISVLQRLGGAIDTLAGLGVGGEGFDQLKAMQAILSGEQTGPAVQIGQGLGQALAGFANSGLLSPELFAELANGIGQAHQQIVNLGQGGAAADRLFQPYLQTIDKLIRDNPVLEAGLDDTTRALLASARASGIVGPQFDPAIDRAIAGIDRLIAKLDEWLARVAEASGVTFPTPAFPSAPTAPGQPGSDGSTPSPAPNGGDYLTPLATGGIVTRPTRALIGEAGPEAVIPLSRSGLAGQPIQITVVSQIDGYEAARAITRYQPTVQRGYGAAA